MSSVSVGAFLTDIRLFSTQIATLKKFLSAAYFSWLAPLYSISMNYYKQFKTGCLEVLELFSGHNPKHTISDEGQDRAITYLMYSKRHHDIA
jgi:hypothetical protein